MNWQVAKSMLIGGKGVARLLVDGCPYNVVIVTYDSEYEEDTLPIVIVDWEIVRLIFVSRSMVFNYLSHAFSACDFFFHKNGGRLYRDI